MLPSKYGRKTAGTNELITGYISHNPTVAWRVVGGQAAVVTPSDGTLRMLNETGTFLWAKAEKPTRISTLVKALQKRYMVSAKTAEADVLAFVKKLTASGMLCIAEKKGEPCP